MLRIGREFRVRTEAISLLPNEEARIRLAREGPTRSQHRLQTSLPRQMGLEEGDRVAPDDRVCLGHRSERRIQALQPLQFRLQLGVGEDPDVCPRVGGLAGVGETRDMS